ncbi:hypothetical protein CY34DRAFT_809566 [Suillus luteus UH-Slu-Lm8-n1]|uniref:Uncharacterized protein n=1 Tax=Suillus luteus UH-Slu-Lm8-n1 TaxID=930992 RepID=A0A0D0B2U0_9AGAM|nr:hypothetical protein CY34DRAFT_809566 [Suillus luteus UH-Slu-Lm8-n1]
MSHVSGLVQRSIRHRTGRNSASISLSSSNVRSWAFEGEDMHGIHDVINIIDHHYHYQTDRNIQDMVPTHPWNKPGGSSCADLPWKSRHPGLYLRGGERSRYQHTQGNSLAFDIFID